MFIEGVNVLREGQAVQTLSWIDSLSLVCNKVVVACMSQEGQELDQRGNMVLWRTVLVVMGLVGALLCATGCTPQVGDSCLTSQECGTGALCDTSAPDGYCTVTPCGPDAACPEESSCVEFENDQPYCMLRCDSDGDCRDGYKCRNDVGSIKFCYIP